MGFYRKCMSQSDVSSVPNILEEILRSAHNIFYLSQGGHVFVHVGLFLSLFVCCQQDDSKCYEVILVKLGGQVGLNPGKKSLNYRDVVSACRGRLSWSGKQGGQIERWNHNWRTFHFNTFLKSC